MDTLCMNRRNQTQCSGRCLDNVNTIGDLATALSITHREQTQITVEAVSKHKSEMITQVGERGIAHELRFLSAACSLLWLQNPRAPDAGRLCWSHCGYLHHSCEYKRGSE